MGNFFGHLLPGLFFLFFGVWWTLQIIWRFYNASVSDNCNRRKFHSSPSYSVVIKGKVTKLDSWIAVACCSIGMFVELIVATIENKRLLMADVQHATMYFFFLMFGLSAIVLPKLEFLLDTGTVTYILFLLAYIVEGLLFSFHIHGKPEEEVVLHTFLVYTIYTCAVVTLLELAYRENVFIALGRAFFTTLQGTWFIQIACILFPPLTDPWGKKHSSKVEWDHDKMMFFTCVYCWHMAALLIFLLFCCWLVVCLKRKSARMTSSKDKHPARGGSVLDNEACTLLDDFEDSSGNIVKETEDIM